jgi:DNA recombination protein RmuC
MRLLRETFMQELLAVLLTILILLVAAALMVLLRQLKNAAGLRDEMVRQSTSVGLLQQQIESIRGSQEKTGQSLEQNLRFGQEHMGQYLKTTQDTLAKLNDQLGQLRAGSEQILKVGQDVRSLQDILKSPKLRGQLGEYSLERLLKEVLPSDSFSLQHSFRNGKRIDALVRMADYTVGIDAKFPLPAFEEMIKAQTDDERTRLRRKFYTDCVKHIDKIAADYIQPEEKTLDFALMYIPAENVYYETIIRYDDDKTDLRTYALQNKVIPVSPNLLYAYLMTVAMGLHGLQIEQQAEQIRKNLQDICRGFTAFFDEWGTLGGHLQKAQGKYNEAQARLVKFQQQLEQIRTQELPGTNQS